MPAQATNSQQLPTSQGEVKRWSGPLGWGARHVNDTMPFTLWDPDRGEYRHPSKTEQTILTEAFHHEEISFLEYMIIIETYKPPRPVPLTIGCMPAIFIPPDTNRASHTLRGEAPYIHPRGHDPCPHLAITPMQKPPQDKMFAIVDFLKGLMGICGIIFLPTSIIVELKINDGRIYGDHSLPPHIAGLPVSYHHSATPFFHAVRNHAHERRLDPSATPPAGGPPRQDVTNYLHDPDWGTIGPGVRLSAGLVKGKGLYARASQSTTCGLRVKKGLRYYVTAANHCFFASKEVFHPNEEGDKIGEVVERYPALDIALVELNSAHASRFTNSNYFQAEPAKKFIPWQQAIPGNWFEIDSMSTGLVSLMLEATVLREPMRPQGHPEIPTHHWKRDTTYRIFGATGPGLLDGMCGAPLVEVETGNVAGFFQLASGDEAWCAALDDLIDAGVELV